MQSIGTPLKIELLLHCYTTPAVHPRFNAPAIEEVFQELLKEGAIYRENGQPFYRTTEKGNAWVAALCAVPPPIQAWKDAATGAFLDVR
jgi:hypothetical protein